MLQRQLNRDVVATGVVWAMKFSHDGKFLATAGQDRMVYIWKVKPGRGDSSAVPSSEKAADQSRNGSSAGSSTENLSLRGYNIKLKITRQGLLTISSMLKNPLSGVFVCKR